MDRKLINIIKSESTRFSNFLNDRLDNYVLEFINLLENQTSLYLFSGIIRDYFINLNDNSSFDIEIRDVDLVYDGQIQIESILNGHDYEINSFGGYKVKIGNYDIDIWNLHDTWGLKKQNLSYEKNSVNYLPKSTFFNFSSILYSFHDKEFIVGDPFVQFYKNKEVDFVYKENPYPELCIVNSIYYSMKRNLKLSENLTTYLMELYKEIDRNKLQAIQIKHFKEVKINAEDFDLFFKEINSNTSIT